MYYFLLLRGLLEVSSILLLSPSSSFSSSSSHLSSSPSSSSPSSSPSHPTFFSLSSLISYPSTLPLHFLYHLALIFIPSLDTVSLLLVSLTVLSRLQHSTPNCLLSTITTWSKETTLAPISVYWILYLTYILYSNHINPREVFGMCFLCQVTPSNHPRPSHSLFYPASSKADIWYQILAMSPVNGYSTAPKLEKSPFTSKLSRLSHFVYLADLRSHSWRRHVWGSELSASGYTPISPIWPFSGSSYNGHEAFDQKNTRSQSFGNRGSTDHASKDLCCRWPEHWKELPDRSYLWDPSSQGRWYMHSLPSRDQLVSEWWTMEVCYSLIHSIHVWPTEGFKQSS